MMELFDEVIKTVWANVDAGNSYDELKLKFTDTYQEKLKVG